MRIRYGIVAAAILLTQCVLPAQANEWPEKSVRIVAPYGPGGGVDTFTRPLATRLAQTLRQPVIVDNRPGAGGTMGVKNVADSPADGYTFLSGGVHQPMAEELYPKRDFVPVALTALVPTVLVVTNAAPFKDVQEMMAYAKANPGKIDYCSSGNGTSQHITAEAFKRLTGLSMTHIPYRGTAAEIVTRMAQEVRAALKDPAVAEAWKRQGGAVPELSDAETARYVQAETARWRRSVVEFGIKVD